MENTEETITELVGDHKRVVEVEKHTGELCEATNHERQHPSWGTGNLK